MIADHILSTLQQYRRGLPARAIARKTGFSLSDVLENLKILCEEGSVRKVTGYYLLAEETPACSPPAKPPPGPITTPAPSADLETLRRICAFHADVVQALASSQLELVEGDDRLAMQVKGELDWFLLAEDKLVIPRNRLPIDQWGARDKRFVFAGPLHWMDVSARRRKSKPVWLPVFLAHVRIRRLADNIEFTLDGSIDVNTAWLDALFTSAEEDLRDDLLIQLGFLEEGPSGKLRTLQVRNLGHCWQALRQWMGADWHPGSDGIEPKEAGVHPQVLLLEENLSPYLKNLCLDLQEIARAPDQDLARSALMLLLPQAGEDQPAPAARSGSTRVVQQAILNPEQLEAVESALQAPLVLVQGPPGTGKSTVVRSVLLSLGLNGGTGLFASRNHRAVEAVLDPLNQQGESTSVVADMRSKMKNGDWTTRLMAHLDVATPEDGSTLIAIEEAIDTLTDQFAVVQEAAVGFYQETDRLAGLAAELADLAGQHPDWAGVYAAIELGPNTHKIKRMAAASRLPWWNPRRYWGWLGCRRLLRMAQQVPHGAQLQGVADLELVCHWQELSDRHALLEREMRQKYPRPAELGEALFANLNDQVRIIHESLPNLPAAWAEKVGNQDHLINQLLNEGRHSTSSPEARRRLQQLAQSNFATLLPGLPLWAITNLSINQVPRVAGAFDLAIVDEAGQCDPSSLLPILFRARRAMIVGDPKQLRPVSQLGLAREEELRRKHGLEGPEFSRYAQAGRSAYDMMHDVLLAQGNKAILLREHYRCHPAIAQFFSREFYEAKLVLRTSAEDLGEIVGGLHWTHVEGGSITVQGSRWHPPQVEAIVEKLVELERAGFKGTVGVVTPFREHAKRVGDAAHARLPQSLLDQWEFVSTTADGFQGGEKDVVFFGLVGGGEGENPTPNFYRRDHNRFNVAVSRARLTMHIVGDREWARRCGVPVLEHLVRACDNKRSQKDREVRWDLVGPVWEPRLAEAMEREGLEFRQQYPTCGFYLDFALFGKEDCKFKLNVEVDGETWHRDRDGNLRAEDRRRDLILRANGWRVERFWVYQLREDMYQCVRQIKQILKNDAVNREG